MSEITARQHAQWVLDREDGDIAKAMTHAGFRRQLVQILAETWPETPATPKGAAMTNEQEARTAGLAAAVQMRDTEPARLYTDLTHLAVAYAEFILTGVPLDQQGQEPL